MQEIKAYLRSYIPALRYAEKCFRELDSVEDISIRSPKMDGMPRSPGLHGLDDQIAWIEAVREKAEKARAKVLAMLDDIEDRIEALENYDQRTVIKLRYIYGMEWTEIANEMSWSTRTVYNIHGRALAEMRKDERAGKSHTGDG